jgi:hypothetical protein
MLCRNNLILYLAFTSAAGLAIAQTNTFPSSGNVGIGTTSPQVPLEIGTNNTYALSVSGTNPAIFFSPITGVFPNGNGVTYAAFLGLSTFTGAYEGMGLGDLNIATQSRGTGNSSAINFLVPSADDGNYTLAGKFTRQGYFGVGTATPAARLHVQANDWSWYQGIFENLNPNTDGGGIQLRNDETGSSGQGGVILMGSSGNYYTSYKKRLSIVSYANGSEGTGSSGITLSMEGASEGPQDIRITNGNQLNGTVFIVTSAGNVGIGTTAPSYPLSVNGTIEAKEVLVQAGWSDFVFDKDYRLPPLAEVEQSIAKDKHLPGMPSAGEVASHGVSVGEMDAKLLQKIEELTLYTIQLQKENDALRERVTALEGKSP